MFFIYFNQNNLCNWLNAEADRRIQLSSIKWDIKEIWKKDKTYHVSYSSLFNKVVIYVILEKAEEPEIKLPTSVGLLKKQERSWKTSISVLLTMLKPLTVWITINCGNSSRDGIPDHLTCLLRNLYASQEAIVRTGHGTTDWFQIVKGVCQGCILSPGLFNYMQSPSWETLG